MMWIEHMLFNVGQSRPIGNKGIPSDKYFQVHCHVRGPSVDAHFRIQDPQLFLITYGGCPLKISSCPPEFALCIYNGACLYGIGSNELLIVILDRSLKQCTQIVIKAIYHFDSLHFADQPKISRLVQGLQIVSFVAICTCIN